MHKFMFQDVIPSGVAVAAIGTKFLSWLACLDFNSIFITLSSFAGFVYLMMKIYDLYLHTKTDKRLWRELFPKQKKKRKSTDI